MSSSYARYSATVSAARGVISRSIVGSSARFMNTTLRASAPVLSNSWMKKAASRWVIPIAPNTTENCSASPRTLACRAIWAAISLAGRPAPEKIGSFCPRTRVFMTSIVEMPV